MVRMADDFLTQLSQILDKVVGEGIIVVDHEKHGVIIAPAA